MVYVKANPAMTSSNVTLDHFFDLSQDLLCVGDLRSGYFLRLSKSWEQVLGYSLGELMAAPAVSFVHPEDRAKTSALMQGHLQGDEVFDFVNRYQRKDGGYRYLSWRASAPDERGLIVATARDVTDEYLAIQALGAERARLRAVMDSIADLVFIKDTEFRYMGCNRPFTEFVGHSEDELVGHDDFAFFPADLAQFFRDNDLAMLETMAPRRNEEWVTYPDGRRCLLDTQKVPLFDADGQRLGLVGVSRDITEQKRLRAQVDFLGSVVNHSRDPLYCISPARDFSIVYVNDAACALLGLSRAEIIASPLSRFNPMMERRWAQGVWQRISASDVPVLLELDLETGAGVHIPVELSASRVRHQDEDYIVGWIHDVSARKAAERQLLEREALFRASVDASADGFWTFDAQGRILSVNNAYVRMSGYSEAELKRMSVADLAVYDSADGVARRIAQIKEQGALSFESRHRRKDGSLWDVEINALYSDVEGGRGFVYVRDMRQRRRAESLLAARLRLAEMGRSGDFPALMTEVLDIAERLTASCVGFFHFVEPDQQHLSLQAWSSNTMAHMCQMALPEPHYPLTRAGIWADCLRQGRAVVVNDYGEAAGAHGLPEGYARISRLISLPVPGEGGFGAVIGVGNKSQDYDDDDVAILSELASVAMDIINRVRAEAAQRALSDELARTAQQWNAAMEYFNGGIALLDKHRRLLRANAAFHQLSVSPKDRVGQEMAGLGPQGGALVARLPEGRAVEMVLEAEDAENPSGKPLSVRAAPIRDAEGRSDGWVLSLLDMTSLREQERRLEQTVRELSSSNAELERFGQVAAHDLQEPTRRQVLFAQLLQRQLSPHLDDESRQYLDFLISDALRMRDMVRALNVYHQAGRTLRPPEPVDLDQLLSEVLAGFFAEIESSGAVVCVGALGTVRAEAGRLHLVFVNLLSNALKFRRSSMVPHVSIEAARSDGMVTLSVADNGRGIPEAYRANLFSLFRRGVAEHEISGTGMGLAQCRRIIEDFGGRIWMEDSAMGGVSVKFTIPAI